MKKIIIYISSGIALTALIIVGIYFLFFNSPSKLPNDSFSHTLINCQENNFYSNKKHSGEYEQYQINFNLPLSTIENPFLKASENVFYLKTQQENLWKVTFNIQSGENFWFSISSDNYETYKVEFSATEYVQQDEVEIVFNSYTDNHNNEYFITQENNNYILYLADQNQSQLAEKERYPNYAEVAFLFKSKTFNHTIKLSNNSCIAYHSGKVSALSLGTSRLELHSQDGSGVVKYYDFTVKIIPISSITGLPNKITIDINNQSEFNLPNHNIIPTFATGHIIGFSSSDESIFTITNNKIFAQNLGEANLNVMVDGNIFLLIPVNIIITNTPHFSFALQDSSKNLYQNNISITNSTITLDASSFTDQYLTITYYVNLAGVQNIYSNIFTNLSVVLGEANLFPATQNLAEGIGVSNQIGLTITLLNQASQTSLKFSNTALNIEKILTIIIEK